MTNTSPEQAQCFEPIGAARLEISLSTNGTEHHWEIKQHFTAHHWVKGKAHSPLELATLLVAMLNGSLSHVETPEEAIQRGVQVTKLKPGVAMGLNSLEKLQIPLSRKTKQTLPKLKKFTEADLEDVLASILLEKGL